MPRTDPWGTPNRSTAGCDRIAPTLTERALSNRYDLNSQAQITDSIKCVQHVKANGVVYGIKIGREIQQGEGCDLFKNL